MARKIIVQVSCDRCGSEVDTEVPSELSLDGIAYRTDLCATHRAELTAALEPFLATAERLEGRRRVAAPSGRVAAVGGGRRPVRRDPLQVGAIRTWARANGYEISDRGRIPREVEDAYNRNSS